MNTNDIISSGLLEQYAMGLASPEERANVEVWLNEFPEVKREFALIEESLETYAMANAVAPSASVKEKILARINSAEESNTTIAPVVDLPSDKISYRIPTYFKMVAAAAILLLVGSIALLYNYYNRYKSVDSELQLAQQKIARIDSVNLAMSKDINVMTDKNARSVVLTGTATAPDALAKIFWMKNTGEVYIDPSNLPATPAGKQYQLWAIIDGKPVDAGMIATEKGIYHIQKMKSFGQVDAFAVTLEKTGGSKAPEGEMFVISKI